MTRPFLAVAVFCDNVETDEAGHTHLRGIFGTHALSLEAGDLERQFMHGFPAFIQINPAGLHGKHVVRLRWVDEGNRPLPGEREVFFNATGQEEVWTISTTALLRLERPRSGKFRFLVELDGSPVGWIPLAVELLPTGRGEP